MDWLNKNWEKLVLLVAALIAIGVAAKSINDSLTYSDQFQKVEAVPSDDLPERDIPRIKTSTALVTQEVIWEKANVNAGDYQTEVQLFKSVPIVEFQGETINLNDPKARKIREPVPNQWFLENNLNILQADILTQDSDDDHFNNKEEWEAKTSPRDGKSHPSYALKLALLSRQQQSYILRFAATPDATTFQIIREASSKWPRATFLMKVGDTSEDGQFRIDNFTKAEEIDARGIRVDASVLDITYLPDERKVQLKRGVRETIPTYYAEIEFTLGTEGKFYVKKGDEFKLSLDPETRYKLVDITEDTAVISYSPGPGQPEVQIEIKKK